MLIFSFFLVTPPVSTDSSGHGRLGRKGPFGTLMANCAFYSCSDAFPSGKDHFSMLVILKNKE
jgi:hypothetical protein